MLSLTEYPTVFRPEILSGSNNTVQEGYRKSLCLLHCACAETWRMRVIAHAPYKRGKFCNFPIVGLPFFAFRVIFPNEKGSDDTGGCVLIFYNNI